ncbi:MAG: hypothetical protein AAGB93_10375 [Planctomycetota bacterium]
MRLQASIDDAGDLLILAGDEITVGHATSDAADLALLADLEGVHARIRLVDSFHGGSTWRLAAEPGAAPPTVDGRAAERAELVDGIEVSFGRGAAFAVRRSDPSSASVVLELARGAESRGARRVVLMAPEEAGRVRIGPRRRRHVPVAGLQHDVAMVLTAGPSGGAGRLVVACDGGARRADLPADGATAVSIDLPIVRRVDLALGAAPERIPPFGIALRPVEEL